MVSESSLKVDVLNVLNAFYESFSLYFRAQSLLTLEQNRFPKVKQTYLNSALIGSLQIQTRLTMPQTTIKA